MGTNGPTSRPVLVPTGQPKNPKKEAWGGRANGLPPYSAVLPTEAVQAIDQAPSVSMTPGEDGSLTREDLTCLTKRTLKRATVYASI